MNNILILVIIILVILCYYLNNNEYFATDLESIANIASIYNTSRMKLTNLDVTKTLTAGTFNLLPTGIITMWSGTIDKIPAGWVFCDGGNGTPDLRSRFIVGSGPGYNVGATGGTESITLTTAQMPSHTHGLHVDNACFKNGGCDNRQSLNWANGTNQNTDSSGGNQPFDNRPPFYALAYIMKT